ncbi:MAG: hypothetical protein ABI947_26255 [Chloroflexota bacterium]
MNIDTFFSQPFSETAYSQVQESDWLDAGTLSIVSTRISIGDAILFPGDQAEFEIVNGLYTIQAKGIDYGNHRRISRLRAFHTPSRFDTSYFASISVDFAVVGICDPTVFLQALKHNTKEGTDLTLYKTLYSDPLEALYGAITLDNQQMIFVKSGWGDGHYDIYQLHSGGQLLGLETVFIDPKDQ